MPQINNLNEAQRIATILRDRPDLDAETRADLMAALRQYDAGQKAAATPAAAPQAPIRPPMDKSAGFGDRTPLIEASSREVLAQAISAGKGLVGVGLDALEFGALASSTAYDALELPQAKAFADWERGLVRDTRDAFEKQAARGLEMATGYTGFPGLGDFIGESLLFGGKALQGKTWTSGVLRGGAAGGVATALTNVEDADSAVDLLAPATFGGLINAGASGALTARWGVPYWAARKYTNAINHELGKRTQALEADIRGIRNAKGELVAPDFSFTTAGLAADNPWLASLEIGAAQAEAIKHQVKAIKSIESALTGMFKSSKNPQEVITGLHQTVNALATRMHKTASNTYAAGLGALATKYGDDVILDARGYHSVLRTYMQEFAEKQHVGTAAGVPPLLQKHTDAVEALVFPFKVHSKTGKVAMPDGKPRTEWVVERTTAGKEYREVHPDQITAQARAGELNALEGGLTLKESQTITKSLNELIGGEVGAFDEAAGPVAHMARVLKAKFLTSMRGQKSPAAAALDKLGKAYRFDEAKVEQLRTSVLGSLFGSKEALPGLLQKPEKALNALIRQAAGPEAMAVTRKLLQAHAPDLLEDVKSVYMQNILTAARDASTPSSRSQLGRGTEIDLERLAVALKGPGKEASAGRVGLGLFAPAEQNQLIKLGQALQVINNTYLKKQNLDASGKFGDMAINLVSMSKEFFARFVVRALSRGATMEKLLVDPGAREMMITLSKKSPDSPAFKMALAGLTYRLGAAEADQDEGAE